MQLLQHDQLEKSADLNAICRARPPQAARCPARGHSGAGQEGSVEQRGDHEKLGVEVREAPRGWESWELVQRKALEWGRATSCSTPNTSQSFAYSQHRDRFFQRLGRAVQAAPTLKELEKRVCDSGGLDSKLLGGRQRDLDGALSSQLFSRYLVLHGCGTDRGDPRA
eukprot:734370-Rhodomonas_salina.3